MKIVLLSGSPRVEGNTNILVKEFIRGAKESGHSVYSFDCAHHTVGGCRSCNFC